MKNSSRNLQLAFLTPPSSLLIQVRLNKGKVEEGKVEDNHKNENDLKNGDNLKNEAGLKNEDDRKNEDDFKNEADLKIDDNLKNWPIHQKHFLPSPHLKKLYFFMTSQRDSPSTTDV